MDESIPLTSREVEGAAAPERVVDHGEVVYYRPVRHVLPPYDPRRPVAKQCLWAGCLNYFSFCRGFRPSGWRSHFSFPRRRELCRRCGSKRPREASPPWCNLRRSNPGLRFYRPRVSASNRLLTALSKLLVTGSKIGLQLVVLLPSGETRAHAATRAQLTSAVRSLAAAAGPDPPRNSFDELLQALRTLSSEQWKQVIYLGGEPAVAPEARDYAYGLLLRTLTGGRILFSHADPISAEVPAWAEALRAAGGRHIGRRSGAAGRAC